MANKRQIKKATKRQTYAQKYEKRIQQIYKSAKQTLSKYGISISKEDLGIKTPKRIGKKEYEKLQQTKPRDIYNKVNIDDGYTVKEQISKIKNINKENRKFKNEVEKNINIPLDYEDDYRPQEDLPKDWRTKQKSEFTDNPLRYTDNITKVRNKINEIVDFMSYTTDGVIINKSYTRNVLLILLDEKINEYKDDIGFYDEYLAENEEEINSAIDEIKYWDSGDSESYNEPVTRATTLLNGATISAEHWEELNDKYDEYLEGKR